MFYSLVFFAFSRGYGFIILLYTLSFRLDSFANSSSIAVTNVATGFVGVTQ